MGIQGFVTEMIEFILHRATRYELELVGEALRRRMERESGLGVGGGRIDVHGAARSMAESIEKQIGIGGDQIHRASRRMVADMIRGENPNISEGELKKLLDQWIPGKRSGAPAIPKDLLLTMITQFVAYSTGEISEEEKRQFPPGWHEKYWAAFTEGIRAPVRDYIRGKIGKNLFWDRIRESLALMK